MADSFFGFDTSLSNVNDDEGGGGPSEDEYDALNDETFGQDSEGFDWEVEHEHLAEQLESSRRHNASVEDHVHSLEASLSQLVVDETDAPQSRTLGSSVWRHDAPFPAAPTPVSTLKNVCTVEELERQLRQKQQQQQQQQSFSQNYNYPPRYPPVILQRPPGLQAPVPLPFAPQQPMTHSQMTLNQMSQPLNNILGNNQLSQTNLIQNMNQMGQSVNQMVQGVNQMGQNVNQMGQNVNQFMQNSNQMGNQFQNNQMAQSNMMNMSQNMQQHQMGQSNQMMGQNVNQMSQNMNQMGQNVNQMGQNVNQIGQNMNQMGQNVNQMGQNMNQMGQNVNQMGQSVNQMGHNVNQMIPNGNQFNHNVNQFQMMNQQRMMAPPPGMTMPRQNFSPSMGQYNQPFRGPTIQSKINDQQPQQINQQNMLMNQQMPQNIPTSVSQKPSNQQVNAQMNHTMNQPIGPQNHMNHVGSQLSPPKQNQMQKMGSQNQIQNQKADLKMQKTRTYNNSSQKNLTSQNLVQLIQNTHPMLQFNNSFHNASHHPMLNNRNNMFMNNNQFTNQLLSNQRLNGTYSNNNRQMNGDGSSVCSDTDEYAGLMTPREKQWLINIQMLQLNTGTPYIHDFYYTVFLERQASKEKETVKEAHKANQQNHPFYSGAVKQEPMRERERHNSGRHNSCSEDGAAPRAYVPQQFENSLGKLQCGSVTAPRKIIDVELVSSEPSRTRAPSVASVTTPAEVPREMRRTKQLLLDIEALYLILLRLEELNDPLAISNALILKEREEKQKLADAALAEAGAGSDTDCNVFLRNIESVQRRAKHDCGRSEQDKRQVVNLAVNQKPTPVKNLLDEDKDDLINKMFLGLLQSDRLVQMMSVRKGRALISRFVCRVPAAHCRLRALWSRVLRGLPHAARREDSALAPLAPLAARYALYIQNASGWQPVLESCSLLAEALDPARTPYALTTPFTLSCVCALIEKASQLTNTPEATSNERQWFKFLKTVARALKNTTLTVAKPVKPLPEAKLLFHIKQLESRSTIEILQRGKTATEFADISKTDVSELLVRYLC